jgi:hypothetical protein
MRISLNGWGEEMSIRRNVRILLTVATAAAAVIALILAATSSLPLISSSQSPTPQVSTYDSPPTSIVSAPPSSKPTGPPPAGGGGAAEPPVPSEASEHPQTTGSAASPTKTRSTGATSPPQSEPSGQRARDILNECVKGRMEWRKPSPLKQGETTEFVVWVAPNASQASPGNQPGMGEPERRDPPLCKRMRADLTSTGGVKIERITSEIISLPDSGYGEWGWHLIGVEPGQHQMVLRLLAPDPDGGTVSIETFRETISVDVGLMYAVSTWIKDMASPLNALFGVVVIVGGWFALLFAQKRRGKHEAKPGPH